MAIAVREGAVEDRSGARHHPPGPGQFPGLRLPALPSPEENAVVGAAMLLVCTKLPFLLLALPWRGDTCPAFELAMGEERERLGGLGTSGRGPGMLQKWGAGGCTQPLAWLSPRVLLQMWALDVETKGCCWAPWCCSQAVAGENKLGSARVPCSQTPCRQSPPHPKTPQPSPNPETPQTPQPSLAAQPRCPRPPQSTA